MEPAIIAGANCVLNPPSNWNEETDGKCVALYVRRDDVSLASAWRPSVAELAALIAGGSVVLTVYGLKHPPVMLSVETVEEPDGERSV